MVVFSAVIYIINYNNYVADSHRTSARITTGHNSLQNIQPNQILRIHDQVNYTEITPDLCV